MVTPLVAEVVGPDEFIIRAIGTTRRGGVDWIDPGLQEFPFHDEETIIVRQGWVVGFISSAPEGEDGGAAIPFVSSNVEGWYTGTESFGSGTPAVAINEPPVLGDSGTYTRGFGFRRYAFHITAALLDPRPPTDIFAQPPVLRPGLAAGSTVATLTAVDANAVETHTFSLVGGDGATDNVQFTIEGASLKAVASLGDDGTRYSIRVRVSDSAGLTFERVLEFTVVGNRPPTAVRLERGVVLSVLSTGSVVGVLHVEDANLVQGDTHEYQLVAGAGGEDNSGFSIAENRLLLQNEPEEGRIYRIRIRATDSTGLSWEEALELPVRQVIGNSLEPRVTATDTATIPIFYTNGVEMSEEGTVDGVSLPLQDFTQISVAFHLFQLRPTEVPDEFLVIGDTGAITVLGTVGELASFSFPNGPMAVQPGDLFFHYGKGIPFEHSGNARPFWYPCPVPPLPGDPLYLGQGNPEFPLSEELRDYAWAVHFTPGSAPGTPSELRVIDFTLQPDTGMITLTWASSPGLQYRITRSSDLKAWDENVQTGIPAGPEATTTRTFGPATLSEPIFYRVEEESP